MKMRKRQQTRKGRRLVYKVGNEYYRMKLTKVEKYNCGQTKLTFERPCGHSITAHDGPSVLQRVAASQCSQCAQQRGHGSAFWKRTGRNFSAEQQAQIRRLRRNGKSYGEIASIASCNPSSVRTFLLRGPRIAKTKVVASACCKPQQPHHPRAIKLNRRSRVALKITQRLAALNVEQTIATKEWEKLQQEWKNRELAWAMERARLNQDLNKLTSGDPK